MSHIFPRHSKLDPPIAVKGKGCYIYDSFGRAYLDGSGGAAVSCLGHGDEAVGQAMKDQIDRLSFAHTGFFTSYPAEALAELLIAQAPGTLDRVYLVSGGSEATEAALKLARQYFVEKGEPQRSRIIARKQSYHGNTLGALSAGGNEWRRAQFGPMLLEMSHIEPCYAYRHQNMQESEEEYGRRAADALEQEIERVGPEEVIAFIAEPVVGATLGAVPPARGYFRRIREICDRHGILLILDEVMCGMGRTGTLFACEQDGVAPDILCMAKGLGAGYQPLGAMLCTREIYDTIAGGSGFFQHGHTYMGHPVAAAAGYAVLSSILERGLVARAAEQGQKLRERLESNLVRNPFVGDIRGRGLFLGIELVRDRSRKTPFDPEVNLASRIKKTAFANGLICYPMQGTIDGRRGDHILLAPPFIIEDHQLDELVEKLATSLDTVLSKAAA